MSATVQCPVCKHYRVDFKCDAFPDGIPEKILAGDHDHSKPFPGDGGIKFESIGKTDDRNDSEDSE